MTEQAKTDTQLVVLEQANAAVALFTEGTGIDALLADVRQKVSSLVPDVTTAKGRKEIASIAHAVAKTKTYLDSIGKELTDQYKEIPKRIDAHRKTIRDTLDALKDEVRAPLTRYEEAEAARIAALQDRMAVFATAKEASSELPSAELDHYLQQIEAIAIDDSWQEMTAQAGVAKDAALLHLRAVIEKAKAREAQAAELERLRQEAAAREQADRERRIAEEAAAAEARRQEQARIDAERQALLAKEREDQARLAAEQAEQRRLQTEANAQRQAEEAAARAAEQERQRIEQEQRQKAEEDARRAADHEHRTSINNAVLMDLMGLGIAEEQAKALICSIAKGHVSHLTISY